LSRPAINLFRLQHRYAPYVFVAPFVAVFLVFGLYPLVKSLVLAFYVTAGPKSQTFVGLGNFAFLLSDPDFHRAVWNTCVFATCSVFLQLPMSLGLALLLNRRRLRGRSAFRFAFFSPYMVGMVFVGVLFSLIFAPRFGLLDGALAWLLNHPGLGEWLRSSWLAGLVGPGAAAWIASLFDNPGLIDTKWLSDPRLVMPALVLTALWMYVGFNMIYFLAALQAVPQDLYDAAQVDGAGAIQQFLHVTLPSIKPVAVFVVVLSTIGSFQLFELPYLMLQNTPGPDNAGLTLVMYLYQNGFVTGDLGYASAIGWTLALGVLVLSLVQMRLAGAWKKEDA
jgi:ABC-type sugar transport system permease subunit